MPAVSGHQKRFYLERYIKYNTHYQEFLTQYANEVPGSVRYEEFQQRKESKDRVRQRLYDEVAAMLEQAKNPQVRFMAELMFLEGFSYDEIANLSGLSEKRCSEVVRKIYSII